MIVVLVLDVQVPAANVGQGHVVAGHLGRLGDPHHVLAPRVLIPDLGYVIVRVMVIQILSMVLDKITI